jgi:hypothetical protein
MLPVYPLCAANADETVDEKLEWQNVLLHKYLARLQMLTATDVQARDTADSTPATSGGCCGGQRRPPCVPPSVAQELAHVKREVRRLHLYVRLLKDGGLDPDETPVLSRTDVASGRVTHMAMWV